MRQTISSQLNVVEEESSQASASADLSKPDPSPERAVAIIQAKLKEGATHENSKRNDRKTGS